MVHWACECLLGFDVCWITLRIQACNVVVFSAILVTTFHTIAIGRFADKTWMLPGLTLLTDEVITIIVCVLASAASCMHCPETGAAAEVEWARLVVTNIT